MEPIASTSEPLYLVRDPIDVLKAFEGGLRQRRLLPDRGHRRDPVRSARRPDGRAQVRHIVVLLRNEASRHARLQLCNGAGLDLFPLRICL